jgi:hypothetical protein
VLSRVFGVDENQIALANRSFKVCDHIFKYVAWTSYVAALYIIYKKTGSTFIGIVYFSLFFLLMWSMYTYMIAIRVKMLDIKFEKIKKILFLIFIFTVQLILQNLLALIVEVFLMAATAK